MRIGLFGGTFNPIHLGHLRSAVEIIEGFHLDHIYLIPAASPPHKTPGDVVAAEDRLEMIQTAISGVAGLLVSDEELKRSGPSYTIDTVLHFKHSPGDPKELYLIMGTDAFLEIDTWYRYQDLLKQIAMIVIDRPNQNRLATRNDREEMHSFLRSKISGDYAFSRSLQCYQHPHRPPIHIFHVTCLRISATMIRKRLKAQRSIGFLVPRSVEDYIQSKGLYV